MKKRWFAILLTLAMCLSLLPSLAMAAEEERPALLLVRQRAFYLSWAGQFSPSDYLPEVRALLHIQRLNRVLCSDDG